VVTDIVRKSDELEYLRAALDNIKDGIVVLDADLNVRHVNGVVKELWRLGDADLRGLNYGDLIRMGRKRGFLPEPPEGSEARIARNLALIRADDPTPNEFQLAGRTVRTRRAALADGGHILTFGDISDFVQRASQLQTMANTDDLTGTPNRRGFMAAAKKEWGRFQRYHRPMSLLSIDIDHFKSINDSFGHDVGDAALVHIANLCKRNRRDSDVVARMGGEEFAILLPETTIEQAINVGERLRAEIAATPCEARGQRVAMTVSLGAAQATLGMAGIHVLMKLADQAMYRAKSGGRNRIEAASSGPDADRLAAE
jgi:diguanylate cyclase (GGDEF)-like protein